MKYTNWKIEAIEQYIKERELEIKEAKEELERREKLKLELFEWQEELEIQINEEKECN
jgi:hypothetical protein